MTRELRALKLQKAPLFLVVAQVVTTPVLQMESYIPKIQESLRKTGFPRFRAFGERQVALGPGVAVTTGPRWLFSDKAAKKAVVVAPDFIVLQTSAYDVFDVFVKELGAIVEVFRGITEVEFSERIGLRYLDLIRLRGSESLADYLRPGLLGLQANELGVSELVHRMESQGKTPMGSLSIRVRKVVDGKFLPRDMVEGDLTFDIDLKPNEHAAVLDIDHFSATPRDFSVAHLTEEMWKLHAHTDRAFRAAVTEEALERWEKVAL